MSKKHKNAQESVKTTSTAVTEHAAEYKVIKHDLIRVIILNAVYLAALLGVFITNQKTHYLEKFVQSFIKF